MPTQVITISPTGALHGLQPKKGKGIDLRQFGRADIKRATIIEWVEDTQEWQVAFLEDGAGVVGWLDLDLAAKALGDLPQNVPGFPPYRVDRSGTLRFLDYEEAVEAEILVINAAKLSGFPLPGQPT